MPFHFTTLFNFPARPDFGETGPALAAMIYRAGEPWGMFHARLTTDGPRRHGSIVICLHTDLNGEELTEWVDFALCAHVTPDGVSLDVAEPPDGMPGNVLSEREARSSPLLPLALDAAKAVVESEPTVRAFFAPCAPKGSRVPVWLTRNPLTSRPTSARVGRFPSPANQRN